MEIWVSAVGIYRVYGLGVFECFCYIYFVTSIEKKTEKKQSG